MWQGLRSSLACQARRSHRRGRSCSGCLDSVVCGFAWANRIADPRAQCAGKVEPRLGTRFRTVQEDVGTPAYAFQSAQQADGAGGCGSGGRDHLRGHGPHLHHTGIRCGRPGDRRRPVPGLCPGPAGPRCGAYACRWRTNCPRANRPRIARVDIWRMDLGTGEPGAGS